MAHICILYVVRIVGHQMSKQANPDSDWTHCPSWYMSCMLSPKAHAQQGQVRGCIRSCLPHNALHLRYQYTTHLLISLMSSTALALVIWSGMENREWGSSDLISVCMDIYIYISTEVIHIHRQQTCNAIAQEGYRDGSDKIHRKKVPYSGIGRGWWHATIIIWCNHFSNYRCRDIGLLWLHAIPCS